MITKTRLINKMWLAAIILIVSMLACNVPQVVTPSTSAPNTSVDATATIAVVTEGIPISSTETATATQVPIVHTLVPGEPSAALISGITDLDSSDFALEHRTNGGDDFSLNLYERPFNAQTMDQYFPNLDIIQTRLTRDSNWYYLNINLVGPDANGQMSGVYGIELDLNIDGRGDLLVMASKPTAAWSTDGVQAWADKNKDVGSTNPIHSDAPVNGDGYETIVFDQGVGTDPDAAWARLSPSDPNSVQIAFKRSLINDDGTFTWGAWAMSESTFNPAWFDFNDHFTVAEAGSPLQALTTYYPIKALAEVDNTCRWAVGFTPVGTEPGICPVPATPVPPTPVLPGSISGVVFRQINGDLIYRVTDIIIPGATVRVRSGSCASAGGVVTTTTTGPLGRYSVSVPAGTYCVDVNPDPYPTYHNKTQPQTVTVANGASVNGVNFGYSDYLG